MNVLFVDDTVQMAAYIGVGGVVFHDTQIGDLFRAFRQAKESHGIPQEAEVKWSPSKGTWAHKNLKGGKRDSAYTDLLRLVESHQGIVIVAVLLKDETSFTDTKAKWQCIEFLTERFQFFLRGQKDRNGIIIMDFPGSGVEEKQLLADYYQLLSEGTDYVKPSNLVMNLLTTESHLNPGLQLADLAVAVTTSMCTPQNSHASRLWPIVAECLHQSATGRVSGCGLKVFPQAASHRIYPRLFPKEFEASHLPEEYHNYDEYIENQRYLYSALMSQEELDMHFPR